MTRTETYDRVMKLLREVGVRPGKKCNIVCAEAVWQIMQNPGAVYGQWTAQILPEVAAALCSTCTAINRQLQILVEEIEDADGGKAARSKLGIKKANDIPSPKEFVLMVYNAVSKR